MKDYNKSNVPLANKLRHEQNEWERKLWYCYLNKYPVRFQRQKPVGNYIADFYCAKAKLIIELDGYYHTTNKQYEKDKQRTEDFENLNLTVIRFTNHEITFEFDKVCKKIDAIVKSNIKPKEQ